MVNFFDIYKNKFWNRLVKISNGYWYYPFLYKSFLNSIFSSSQKQASDFPQYFSAVPNPRAGIGHQISNWIAGFWFAIKFELQFAHISFSSPKWEKFLGFGSREKNLKNLIKIEGYKRVGLPLFDENNKNDLKMINNIIKSYSGERVVFVCEQDQFYKDQYGVRSFIKNKFFQNPEREKDHLVYNSNKYNIAVHIRRGDISSNKTNLNLKMRWQDDSYFFNTLKNALNIIDTDKEINIYIFSQGNEEEFSIFHKSFSNLHFCLEMSAIDSFLHMVYADCLISSKSSFSYKPALLSKGLKIVPSNFWHTYPNESNWIVADENGSFIPRDKKRISRS